LEIENKKKLVPAIFSTVVIMFKEFIFRKSGKERGFFKADFSFLIMEGE
jgi:hypothetical protein